MSKCRGLQLRIAGQLLISTHLFQNQNEEFLKQSRYTTPVTMLSANLKGSNNFCLDTVQNTLDLGSVLHNFSHLRRIVLTQQPQVMSVSTPGQMESVFVTNHGFAC